MSAPDYFIPTQNVIVDIITGISTEVWTHVNHSFNAGQVVKLNIPIQCGMQQLNGYEGEIEITGAFRFSIPVDSRDFDPFVHIIDPIDQKYIAQVIPTGENALTLDCATINNNNILPETIGPIPINP
jgi:hypothetical protein